MKYNFSFLQIVNWLWYCRETIDKIADESENISKKELLFKLEVQRQKLLIIKDVLDRKTKLHGISTEFLKKLDEIKKFYDIKDE